MKPTLAEAVVGFAPDSPQVCHLNYGQRPKLAYGSTPLHGWASGNARGLSNFYIMNRKDENLISHSWLATSKTPPKGKPILCFGVLQGAFADNGSCALCG